MVEKREFSDDPDARTLRTLDRLLCRTLDREIEILDDVEGGNNPEREAWIADLCWAAGWVERLLP